MGVRELIQTFGTLGILGMVFAESGILAGFFLPGDSLLFTAGLLAARGDLDLATLLVGCPLAAIAGDQVGYAFGRRVGPALFGRPDARLFRRRHAERAQAWFADHGPKTVVLGRFLPVVRPFVPVVAGVGGMPYRRFVAFNVVGALAWGAALPLLGYTLGAAVPDAERWVLPAVAVIFCLSFLPVLWEAGRRRPRAREAAGDPDGAEPTPPGGAPAPPG